MNEHVFTCSIIFQQYFEPRVWHAVHKLELPPDFSSCSVCSKRADWSGTCPPAKWSASPVSPVPTLFNLVRSSMFPQSSQAKYYCSTVVSLSFHRTSPMINNNKRNIEKPSAATPCFSMSCTLEQLELAFDLRPWLQRNTQHDHPECLDQPKTMSISKSSESPWITIHPKEDATYLWQSQWHSGTQQKTEK